MPASKPIRYSLVKEANPVLSVNRNKVTTFTSIDPRKPVSPKKVPNQVFFPNNPQEKKEQEEENAHPIVQEQNVGEMTQEGSSQEVVQEETSQESPHQTIFTTPIRDSLELFASPSESSSTGRGTAFEMDSLLEDVTLDELLTTGMEMIPEESKQSSTPSVKQSSVKQSLDVNTFKSIDVSTGKSMQSIQCMVMFDFQSSNEQEISVYEGDFVTVKSIVGEWCLIQTRTNDVSI